MNQVHCSIEGVVIKGKQLGRTIGFPTANLSLPNKEIQLKHGVYGVTVSLNGQQYYGVMNVGIRPTFDDYRQVSYEVHLFHFNQMIYNERLQVTIHFFVRQETSFPNINQLILQIGKDVDDVKKQFGLRGEDMNAIRESKMG